MIRSSDSATGALPTAWSLGSPGSYEVRTASFGPRHSTPLHSLLDSFGVMCWLFDFPEHPWNVCLGPAFRIPFLTTLRPYTAYAQMRMLVACACAPVWQSSFHHEFCCVAFSPSRQVMSALCPACYMRNRIGGSLRPKRHSLCFP